MRRMRCVGGDIAIQKLAIFGIAVHVIASLGGRIVVGAAFFALAVLASAAAGALNCVKDLDAVGGLEIRPDHFQAIFGRIGRHGQELPEIASLIGDAPLSSRGAGGRK